MALFVSSLNSGSNGNCYYIGNAEDAILVDAGISCREIEKRLKRLDLSIRKVRAVFVTHEHGDHIHGITTLSRRHKIPVYITQQTLSTSRLALPDEIVRTFTASAPVKVGGLSVTGFPVRHDAAEPHNFVVTTGQISIGIFTDIGYVCENVIHHFRQCHAAFLESNYDEDMLENGKYPYPLKNRIRGGFGHLSNRQSLKLFRDHKPAFMSHVFLSHLSRENNSPQLAAAGFQKVAGRTTVVVASRYEETSLYEITGQFYNLSSSPYSRARAKQSQLAFDFQTMSSGSPAAFAQQPLQTGTAPPEISERESTSL